MKAKIIGITVFLVLALSIAVAGVGAVSQALGAPPGSGTEETILAQYSTSPPGAEPAESGKVYTAFTFICPFH